ncbi:carA2 [Symbiodinium pilosum]|uniref:CarA2 protein n=1 Tax=Symbiodinium pilosum TaxID=2952 RepID=A0A812RUE0_SYMPI|nr:carA2 [Symbiodinium pilosum]
MLKQSTRCATELAKWQICPGSGLEIDLQSSAQMMQYSLPPLARIGLTVWPFIGLAFGTTTGKDCASNAASLLAVKAETHVAELALLEDAPINFTNGSNASINETLEGLVSNNIVQNMKEIKALPNPENRSNSSSNGTDFNGTANDTKNGTSNSSNGTAGDTNGTAGSQRPKHGFGELAVNLEFITLKLAQLETVAELQQVEIHKLLAKVDEQDQEIKKLKQAQTGAAPSPPTSSLSQESSRARVEEAQKVFKKVVQKHFHQRQKREFVTPFSGTTKKAAKESGGPKSAKKQARQARQAPAAAREDREALLQRSTSSGEGQGNLSSLDTAVSAKWVDDVVDTVSDVGSSALGTITDGTGMIGDALGDAYEHAADQISFVANTVIDTVEMAVTILLRGFTDWDAACPDMQWPSMTVNSNGLYVDWGKQYCYIRLMGQSITLLDFDFGETSLSWPEPIKTVTRYGLEPIKAVVNIGREIVSCATEGSVTDVFKCFGNKLLEVVPPLNFLNRIGDMIQEFIEVFAHIATAVINTILKDSSSLIQQAVNSSFPAVGSQPVVHHTGRNLVIKTHAQRRPGATSAATSHPPNSAAQVGAKLKRARRDDDDDDSDGGITFEIHDNEANYATKLITQFAGKETDTSSCLAFAPKTRRGADNTVTKRDWQVGDYGDFIQLEPWAVPCDNEWMQENPDKWEGYSFYTWESAIEKCVTVSYSMSTQPVLAFVGGLQFDLLPSPLTEMETTVCWPDKQPGGVDLSVLRTVILSGGVPLFSRTLRLTKRFGSNTDFKQGNIFPAHETWRNPIGIATAQHGVEDDRSLEAMDREALLQNESYTKNRKPPPKHQDLHWTEEEVHLASMLYDRYMNTTMTSQLRGPEARRKLRLMQEDQETGTSSDFELFSFANPGLVSFNIRGILANNDLQIGLKVSFGPFTSPEKRITLVNIVDHYRLVLSAMPFVSVDTRLKALDALKNFSTNDVSSASTGTASVVGEAVVAQNYKSPGRNYLAFSTRQHGQVTNLWQGLIAGDMTWEVMMKFHETPPYQTNIMGSYEFNDNSYSTSNRRRSVGLFIKPDGRHFIGSALQGERGSAASGPNLFDHKWHHVVLVLSKSTQKAYYFIDGVRINSADYLVGNQNPSIDGTITIGGGHLGRNFDNQVSRFAIWSRAWSQEDATKALTCGVDTTGLKVLYTLDGGFEDIEDHYLDLRSVGPNGAFVTCSDCSHCATYASTSVSIR